MIDFDVIKCETGLSGGHKRKRKKNQMDYAREIPFQKPAPIGVFDTGTEVKFKQIKLPFF